MIRLINAPLKRIILLSKEADKVDKDKAIMVNLIPISFISMNVTNDAREITLKTMRNIRSVFFIESSFIVHKYILKA